MRFDAWTFALQTVNFLVLVWLLRRFLYRPVLKLIDARRRDIEGQYQASAAAQAEARKAVESAAAERARLASEQDALLKNAAEQAQKTITQARARAAQESAALIEETRKTLATERTHLLLEARRLAADLGCDIARQLLGEVPPEVRAQGWLEHLARYLTELPPAARERLIASEIRVHTALPLSAEDRALWRARLEPLLGDALTIDFDTEPALIAGVELELPSTVIRFSWQDALRRARSDIESLETPRDVLAH